MTGVHRALTAGSLAALAVLATSALSGCMDVAGSADKPSVAVSPAAGSTDAVDQSQDGLAQSRIGTRHRGDPGAATTATLGKAAVGPSGSPAASRPGGPGVVAGQPSATGNGAHGTPAGNGGGGGVTGGPTSPAASSSASAPASPPPTTAAPSPPPASSPPATPAPSAA
ncbi:hypothetical protein [Streptacidiphilus sp. EB129]|uniref:hypothetical protein n=1 Tax=Streptacidiphilus sp. EB129 TaxID=3156262 RepID=UPI0035132843